MAGDSGIAAALDVAPTISQLLVDHALTGISGTSPVGSLTGSSAAGR